MIPDRYKWLETIGTLPRMVTLGLSLIGTRETAGVKNNPVIMAWVDDLVKAGVKVEDYKADSIAWCGLFIALLAYRRRGLAGDVVNEPLWARNWRFYGVSCIVPALGDILTFARPGGGGHVGIYIAEDLYHYHVLGGNQGDAVSIVSIKKERLITSRRPRYNNQPASVKPYKVTASGVISRNEA